MISLNWVSDYIDLNGIDLKELATKITKAGINVEKVITSNIKGLVVGEVIECTPHPNSDRLKKCLVDIGTDKLNIVCGAPNVRKGIKVIVAPVGTILPGNFEIKKSVIRGEESNGMICALFELGLEEKNDETYSKGIHELEDSAVVGDNPLKYVGNNDTLYELDIHKHRNNDCYYHIGFAYEIGAILNKKVTLPSLDFKTGKESIKGNFDLEVNTGKCTYYMAREVKNVMVGESPDFIKKRLISAGMRPINNVVDISNYVMLEFGQPLHFFDKDKLGNKIVVRDAKEGEEITTLDGKERILTSNDIVITNGEKPVCIAGIMGGENTEVDENTKNILIESAIFDPVSIRYTSKRLELPSEASIRYGKGLNYEYTEMASKRACHLLEKYASAEVLEGFVLVDKEDHSEKKLSFYPEEVDKLLGMKISEDDMKFELDRLGFNYQIEDGKFNVIIPKRRLDIDPNVNDIAEEIGRLYGYNNLVSTLPIVPIRRGEYTGDVKYRKIVSKRLRSLGLNEVRTYTLVDKKTSDLFSKDKKVIEVPNPMSQDRSVLRKSMIPSLIDVIKYNKSRGLKDINIYEISKVFFDDFKEENYLGVALYGNYISTSWNNSKIKTDFYVIKGIVENLLDYLGLKNRYSFVISTEENLHPGISADIILDRQKVGFIGRVHPKLEKDEIYVLELSIDKLNVKTKPIKFKPASKLPSITKDLAFIVDKNVTSEEVEKLIKKSGSRMLTNIEVFDVYTGENVDKDKKSIAYKLTFTDMDKTLTDEEVMNVFNKIIDDVTSKMDAKLRNM